MTDLGREFRTVDTHTGGGPTRVLVGGLDPASLAGDTVADRRAAFEADADWLRRFLLQEPRGHADMFGALPLGPGVDTDLDVFFMDTAGYLDMCGHALIGVVTALCETGRYDPAEIRRVGTPAGIVEVEPTVSGDRLEAVSFRNVGSYVCDHRTVTVEGQTIPVSVVAAGNYVVLVDLDALDREFGDAPLAEFVDFELAIRAAVNRQGVTDPVTGEAVTVSLAELYQHGDTADRNLVVFGDGAVDRSPCGTGTAAKLALLYEQGRLGVGEPHVQESPIGTRFEGRVRAVETVDGVPVVTPEVTGSAHRTGEHTFYLDPRDELSPFSLAD
ncbi:MAG: proline racemase family protein [Halorientalis sp.]